MRCGAIEHKMGIHGSATCVMNFDDAEGWLIGEPHKGLMAMFTMMNGARLSVGLQGLGPVRTRVSERAALRPRPPADARAVRREIPGKTGRSDHRPPRRAAHAADSEGADRGRPSAQLSRRPWRWISLDHGKDEAERAQADALLGFLTPIVKACLTEWAIECTYHAQQCFGGHGYIQEWGMEQLARDARITTMYEGTTGIQALDLMGRKVMQLKGAGLKVFLGMIESFCTHAGRQRCAGRIRRAAARSLRRNGSS